MQAGCAAAELHRAAAQQHQTDERVVRQLNEIGAVGNDTQLIELALSCIYAYNKPFGKDCEDQMTDIFESLPMRVKEGERKFDRQEHGKRYQNVQTQVDDLDDVMTAARVFSKWGYEGRPLRKQCRRGKGRPEYKDVEAETLDVASR